MREPFAGPGPWSVGLGGHPYVQTPDDNPAYLYQNLLVALDRERGINIGEPRWHACWLAACNIKVAETVVQIGAGSGYYTAILAHLVGPDGRVYAYEIDEALAVRASKNLIEQHQVEVRMQSGVAPDLPQADLIYVCAGAAQPSRTWLDALRPGGRLLFPLAPTEVLRRHAADHASRSRLHVACEVRNSRRVHRLRGPSRRRSRASFDGRVFKELGSCALASPRRITRRQLLVCG